MGAAFMRDAIGEELLAVNPRLSHSLPRAWVEVVAAKGSVYAVSSREH